jgi:hypothetical protein
MRTHRLFFIRENLFTANVFRRFLLVPKHFNKGAPFLIMQHLFCKFEPEISIAL